MFGIFNRTKEGITLKIKIGGMHCTSCSLTIDGELEDIAGVFESSTNYARSEAVVRFDPSQVNVQQMLDAIIRLGYTAESLSEPGGN